MANPNNNCLEGMSCPACGQHKCFRILGTAVFWVYDDGTDHYSSVEWCDNDHASCVECEWEGTVGDLKEKGRSEEEIR